MGWLADRVMPEPNTGCLLWLGYVNHDGYARSRYEGRMVYVHRVAYGKEVPAGWQIHHLCETRCCMNSAHMVAMPAGDHSRISQGWTFRTVPTHCKRGHPLSGENLYRWRNMRRCRECARVRAARRRAA